MAPRREEKHFHILYRRYKRMAALICNRCGKVIRKDGAVAHEDYLQVRKNWGYFSNKDCEHHEFLICEKCYDTLLKQFVIPVQVTETKELL
jgi:ribosomal-protein-alanine N-acetyltransferase